MQKYKVSELEGKMLNAAVSIAQGWVPPHDPLISQWREARVGRFPGIAKPASASGPIWLERRDLDANWSRGPGAYSELWALAGPIIDRERIAVYPVVGGWQASMDFDRRDLGEHAMCGPTALIAAMRAYAAGKFGEEFELP